MKEVIIHSHEPTTERPRPVVESHEYSGLAFIFTKFLLDIEYYQRLEEHTKVEILAWLLENGHLDEESAEILEQKWKD